MKEGRGQASKGERSKVGQNKHRWKRGRQGKIGEWRDTKRQKQVQMEVGRTGRDGREERDKGQIEHRCKRELTFGDRRE